MLTPLTANSIQSQVGSNLKGNSVLRLESVNAEIFVNYADNTNINPRLFYLCISYHYHPFHFLVCFFHFTALNRTLCVQVMRSREAEGSFSYFSPVSRHLRSSLRLHGSYMERL